MRVGVDKILQAHQLDMLAHGVALFLRAQGRILERDRHVLFDVEPREQTVILKHDAALQTRAVDGLAIEQDAPLVLFVQAKNQAQQGGLAATAGADDADEFAGGDVELDIVQYLQLAGAARSGSKALADVFQGQAVIEHAAILLKVPINAGQCRKGAASVAQKSGPVH